MFFKKEKKVKKEIKKDPFVYKITDNEQHNMEFIKRLLLKKYTYYRSVNNLEVYNMLNNHGFNSKYFNLSDIIGNINYGFCIIKMNDKFVIVDPNFYTLYKNNVIKNPIISDSEGIKFVNQLSIYGFAHINDKIFNMYLNIFDNIKEKIELVNLYKDKTYRR